MGLHAGLRSAETFLLLTDLDDDTKVRIAFVMYGLYRTVQCLRHNADGALNVHKLLQIWTRRAADGCRDVKLLLNRE